MIHTTRKGFLASFTLLIFGVLFFTACKKKVEPVPNRAPEPFLVEVTLEADGTTVNLNWSKAIDPDGDVVSYTVVLGDTLAKSLTDTTFIITDLGYDYIKDGKVIANDPAGLSSEATFDVITSESPTPNRAPEPFLVEVTLAEDGTTVNLNWSKSIDPDGDVVSYTVVLGDTLAKSLTDTTFVITDLGYDYIKDGKVIANDLEGLRSEVSFTVSTAGIPFIAIPDVNFEKYLVDNKIDKDGVINGRIAIADVKGVRSIECAKLSIASLEGIEQFSDLEILYCSSNILTSLDVSKNVNLELLWCDDNFLTSLDVSKNVNLKSLGLGQDSITSSDLSKNVNLKSLGLGQTSITSLDLSKNVNLLKLYCPNNSLASLDLSKNIILEELYCTDNSLTILDVSKNGNLEYLYCTNNSLTALDLSKNLNLKILDCSSNSLTILDVSKNVNLLKLYCTNNSELSTICVSDVAKAKAEKYWYKDETAEYKVCD